MTARVAAPSWYETIRFADDVRHIHEPWIKPFFRCNMWHVQGRDADLLLDTGLGHFPLRSTISLLRERPVLGRDFLPEEDRAGAAPVAIVGYRVWTEVLFASQARCAVVLRRGPKRHAHLLTWSLEDDAFVRGQWMRGVIRLQDLSPDGRKLLYWAAQYSSRSTLLRRTRWAAAGFDPLRQLAPKPARANRRLPRYLSSEAQRGGRPPPRAVRGTWTAVSTPPYFSALAIWPAIGSWTGGGLFLPDGRIVVFERDDGMTPIENVAMPLGVVAERSSLAEASRRNLDMSAARGTAEESALHVATVAQLKSCGARHVDWVSFRDGEDMLFAADGSIWRLPGWTRVPPERYLSAAWRLIDLTDDHFTPLAAPDAAMHW